MHNRPLECQSLVYFLVIVSFNASWYRYKYFEWENSLRLFNNFKLSDFQSFRNISIWYMIKNSCPWWPKEVRVIKNSCPRWPKTSLCAWSHLYISYEHMICYEMTRKVMSFFISLSYLIFPSFFSIFFTSVLLENPIIISLYPSNGKGWIGVLHIY